MTERALCETFPWFRKPSHSTLGGVLVSSLNQTLAVYSMLAMAAGRDFTARTHASILALFFASSALFSRLNGSGGDGGGDGGGSGGGDDCGDGGDGDDGMGGGGDGDGDGVGVGEGETSRMRMPGFNARVKQA
jgi:hypothetical protein